VGYREVIGHLAGELDLQAAIQHMKFRTRRFAKRQRTWFRSLSECRFVAVPDDAPAAELAERIWKQG
jgi:tRNA dimethylallyltransferase